MLAGIGVVAMTLAVVAVSGNGGPVERLGMPMMAVGPNGQEFEVIDLPESAVGGMEGGQQPRAMAMERKGPEFLSSNPQMQILTCFGHCGADCQAYCEDNYLACTHNDPASRSFHDGPTYLEPAPDYYAPTGRGHGGADHVNWCRATLERCKGHCQ